MPANGIPFLPDPAPATTADYRVVTQSGLATLFVNGLPRGSTAIEPAAFAPGASRILFGDLTSAGGSQVEIESVRVVFPLPAADVAGSDDRVLPTLRALAAATPGTAEFAFEGFGEEAPRLRVFDAAGRLVRALEAGAGSTRVPWDGRDAQGRGCAAGLYFAAAEAGAGRAAARVALTR